MKIAFYSKKHPRVQIYQSGARTPRQCAAAMNKHYRDKGAAIEQARKELANKNQRYWGDVLAALGDPEFISK